MHEMAVTESILEIANRHARQANAARVTHVYLVIGQLSSIVDDSVQFYWDHLAQNTLCEKATLHFERIPAILKCQVCGKEYPIDQLLTPCPACESSQVKVISGNEFRVDSIEIEN